MRLESDVNTDAVLCAVAPLAALKCLSWVQWEEKKKHADAGRCAFVAKVPVRLECVTNTEITLKMEMVSYAIAANLLLTFHRDAS